MAYNFLIARGKRMGSTTDLLDNPRILNEMTETAFISTPPDSESYLQTCPRFFFHRPHVQWRNCGIRTGRHNVIPFMESVRKWTSGTSVYREAPPLNPPPQVGPPTPYPHFPCIRIEWRSRAAELRGKEGEP